MVKNPPAKAGDAKGLGSIPGLGRSPGGRNGNLLQYSCLENSLDRGAWQAIVHSIIKESDTTEQLTHVIFSLEMFHLKVIIRKSSNTSRM